MYFKEYYPSEFYSKYIDSYFEIDSRYIIEDITDLVVPDGTFGLLFIDEKNLRRSTSINNPPITLKKSTIFGQKTKPINYYFTKGSTSAFGIKINPCGFHLFTGLTSKEFKDLFVEIDLLGNLDLMDLESKVFEAEGVDKKIKAVEDYILLALSKYGLDDDHFLFESIVEYIYSYRGEVRFQSLTETFNTNYKKIERLFDKYLGISPKTYIRIVRFNAAVNLHMNNKHESLTQIGLQLGFFDQSHFIRDFKKFTSLSPRNFFDKEISASEEKYLQMLSVRWSN
ncbi:helix-turn-helix domain-containing protein [Winogradskyella sp. 3972H.M.0a.05]|uniref:helix-turn-helix domain-containing protein n=1 Tax=Winogradskyella sp. 3972H.M.0a.05 TaxID=2950277 RepID=UPI003390A7DA